MYDKLPQYIYLNGEKYIINSDYRIFIEFEQNMQGTEIEGTIQTVLRKFYPAFNLILEKGLLNEAVEKFIWFYSCGKEYTPQPTKKQKAKKISQIFSYKHDADMIWSAYWMYAHIDLSKEKLHWWKFRAIWNSLPSECEFVKIKGYRAYDGKDKDLLELKEAYKLPPTEAEIKDQVRRDKIYEALK